MSAYSMVGYGMIVSVQDREHPYFDYQKLHDDVKTYVRKNQLGDEVDATRPKESFAGLALTLAELFVTTWPELSVVAPGIENDRRLPFMIVVRGSLRSYSEGSYSLDLEPIWTREEEMLKDFAGLFLPHHRFAWHIAVLDGKQAQSFG